MLITTEWFPRVRRWLKHGRKQWCSNISANSEFVNLSCPQFFFLSFHNWKVDLRNFTSFTFSTRQGRPHLGSIAFLHVSGHAALAKTGEQTFSRILRRKKAARRYGSSNADPFRRGAWILFGILYTDGTSSERKMTTLIYVYCSQQFLCLWIFFGSAWLFIIALLIAELRRPKRLSTKAP